MTMTMLVLSSPPWPPSPAARRQRRRSRRGILCPGPTCLVMVTSVSQHYVHSEAATESEDVDPPPVLVPLLRHGVDPGAPHGVQPVDI